MGEAAHFLNALRFLTIIPTPDAEAVPEDWLIRALKYFPVVGILIGSLSATVLLISGSIWGGAIPALLAVTASMALTGCLHEDGLADTVDGFGGGWSLEQRLAIMKDSRIGTYGTVALGLGVALRVAALATLPLGLAAAALIGAHAVARLTPAAVIRVLRHSGDVATMKVRYSELPMRAGEIAVAMIAALLALCPLVLLAPVGVVIGIMMGTVLALALARWSRRLIGGYTGDVLGAVEQMFEIGFLLGVAALIG